MANSTQSFAKWRRSLERIENEQLLDLLISRHIFNQMQECTAPYVGTYHRADLSQWMVQNYIAFTSTVFSVIIEPDQQRMHVSRGMPCEHPYETYAIS